jgi:hypothetical protein
VPGNKEACSPLPPISPSLHLSLSRSVSLYSTICSLVAHHVFNYRMNIQPHALVRPCRRLNTMLFLLVISFRWRPQLLCLRPFIAIPKEEENTIAPRSPTSNVAPGKRAFQPRTRFGLASNWLSRHCNYT